jgi:uncharacterized membrane protein YdjX (TVP38/TMEM64 family)
MGSSRGRVEKGSLSTGSAEVAAAIDLAEGFSGHSSSIVTEGLGGFIVIPFLLGFESSGPAGYLLSLFLYAVAAAVALPTPVELLLPFYPEVNPLLKATVLGLGKGVGAVAVFFVGKHVNTWLERWSARHARGRRILGLLEAFVRRTGWIGLLVLLAIPLMSDTAVNYFYSLLNREAEAVSRWRFVLANVVGGVVRALIFLWIFPI